MKKKDNEYYKNSFGNLETCLMLIYEIFLLSMQSMQYYEKKPKSSVADPGPYSTDPDPSEI